MTERETLLEMLRVRPLPFAVSTVGSAWEGRAVDVRAVHRPALNRIRALVDRVARRPGRSAAALVVGQAGAGKTHLLGTLCTQVVPEAGRYAFVEVRPLIDPARPYAHLLREVTGSLLQKPPGYPHATQLEAISARTVAGFLEEIGRDVPALMEVVTALRETPDALSRIVNPERWDFLVDQVCTWGEDTNPALWPPALGALFQYALPAHRTLAAAWLRGEALDDEELAAALLPTPGATGPEDRAALTLRTLGHLSRHDRPLVVCFDQLENLDTPERRAAFAAQLQLLTGPVPGVVVVCAVRGDRWEKLCEDLPAPLVERFERERIELGPCPRGAALELVRRRLTIACEGLPVPPQFPFDTLEEQAALEEIVTSGLTPRVVLQRANRRWLALVHPEDQPQPPPATENAPAALDRWLRERREAIASAPERHPPDGPALTEALSLVLAARQAPAPGGHFPRAALAAGRVPIYVDTDRHHRAVGATLRAADTALDNHAAGAVYLRDARLPIPPRPRWPTTNHLREELGRHGALIADLTPEQATSWLALVMVVQAVRSQDVTRAGTGQPVTEGELAAWLRGARPLPGMDKVLAYLARHW